MEAGEEWLVSSGTARAATGEIMAGADTSRDETRMVAAVVNAANERGLRRLCDVLCDCIFERLDAPMAAAPERGGVRRMVQIGDV